MNSATRGNYNGGVYSLIAATSKALKKTVTKMSNGSKPKHPKPILEITEKLCVAHDQETTVNVMKEFIRVYG